MSNWRPVSRTEFEELLRAEYAKLSDLERNSFDRFRVEPWLATVKRSGTDEQVYVVAQKGGGVLYFDDVEYGFNISTVDSDGRLSHPGGGQWSLGEAVSRWFP
jgi:hypothetical protein